MTAEHLCSPRVWLVNNAVRYLIVMFWMAINGIVFWRTYLHYKYSAEFFYLHEIVGAGLCISRGTASVINLNLGVLLLPMCRCLIAFLRAPRCWISPRSLRALLDHCKGFHILCGVIVAVASAIHLLGHVFNAYNFSEHYNPRCGEVNAAKRAKQEPLLIVLYSVPGITGILLTLILSMIVSSAMYSVRYTSYDLFWYVHRLYPIFYILALVHALRGILRQQYNTERHTPGCLYFNQSTNQLDPDFLERADAHAEPIPWAEAEPLPEADFSKWHCDEPPEFGTIGPSTWMWVVGPLAIYVCDVMYRYLRRQHHPAAIVGVTSHHKDVVEILLKKEGFSCRPGQFILVQCPNISSFEWHPYTVTKCPAAVSKEFTLHVKATGDWSGKLLEVFTAGDEDVSDSEHLIPSRSPPARLYLDGPFGSPMEDVLKYRVCVCIAGGIGITPFAAIFNHLKENPKLRPKRLYLVWICRDISGYVCFTRLLCDVYRQTSFQDLGENQGLLTSRVQYGRPKWDVLLHNIAASHRRTDVGVFSCGPKSLNQSLETWCDRTSYGGTVFHYHHESF